MRILALDLGKYKTVGCDYEAETGGHSFEELMKFQRIQNDYRLTEARLRALGLI